MAEVESSCTISNGPGAVPMSAAVDIGAGELSQPVDELRV